MFWQFKCVTYKDGLEVTFTRSLSLKWKLLTNHFKSGNACGVIYKVTCSCCKKYFGETGRIIEERIKEHQVHINNEKSVEKITVYHNILEKVEIHLLSNLYKTTTFGTTQKESSWTGGCLIKHLYKTTTNQIWSFLEGF